MLMDFLVDFLLLSAAARLCGHPIRWKRALLAAGIGAVYAGVSLLQGVSIFTNTFWRLVILGTMCIVAFGRNLSALRSGCVFIFLNMALGGIALGLGNGGAFAFISAAAAVYVLCAVRFGSAAKEYVTVRLTHGGITRELIALKDTGNVLTDPITGKPVLVVGSDVAKQMLGLTQEQLLSPIETMAQCGLVGLRLIPYRSVGNANGMMLAMRMERVCVGKREIGDLVAFAPQILGAGEFQALAGGVL